jgi:Putative adhesin
MRGSGVGVRLGLGGVMSLCGNVVDVPARVVLVVSLLALTAAAQEKKELTYNVGPRAVVSITNNYGPITVKPSASRQVMIETVTHSDAVSLVNEQHGDRIELQSMSTRPGTNLVDYTVLVPVDAFVSLRSSDGTLRASGLRGDVILEAAAASVEVTDISDAHLHVKTLSGPISLTDIRNSHLDIHSVSGNVTIRNVTGPSVEVNSGSGRISYSGDPGPAGEYLLTSHSGDLDVSIPASSLVDIKARSVKGQSDPEFPIANGFSSADPGNQLFKPGKILGSRFELRSFRGKISLKRP